MVGFIGVAAKFVADFLSNIINGVVTKWMDMRESRKRGKAEERNRGHEENARRAAKASKIFSQPIKTGSDLIAGLRDRTSRVRDDGSANT